MGMVGCSSGAGMETYEGANMRFQYNAKDWNVSYRTVMEENTIVELKWVNGGRLSILSCEGETTGPKEVYENLKADDEQFGEVSENSNNDNMSEAGGSAVYEHLVKTDFMGDYWSIVYGKNAGEGKIIIATTCLRINPEDEKATEECKEAMQGVIDSLESSETSEVGKIEESEEDSATHTSFLVRYLTDGKGIIDEKSGSSADEPAVEDMEGYSYVKKITFVDDVTFEAYTIYAPIAEDEEPHPFGTRYYEHGISFSLHTLGKWKSRTAEDAIDEWCKTRTTELKADADTYQNIQVDDKVILEEGLCGYQHISAETQDYTGMPITNHIFGYAGTAEHGIGYEYRLELDQQWMDAETNTILKELGECYGFDLTQYGISDDTLTNSGERMDESQDIYEPTPGEPEVVAAEGYTYMGYTEIDDFDGNKVEVAALMCDNTSNSSTRVSASMHGVSMYLTADILIGDSNVMHMVGVSMKMDYEDFLNNTRDYKNPVASDPIMTTEGDGIYGIVSADYVLSDGSLVPQHEIAYCLPIDEKNYLNMRITLDEREYDARTNDVLKDLEKAYRMDLSDYYYEP